MGGWNKELGENLLMKNDKGGWNKQVRRTFSSKAIHGLGGMFSLGVFSSVNTFIMTLIVLD